MARRFTAAASLAAVFLAALCATGAAAERPSPAAGTDSGLPVPRMVSLKAEGANGRRGPGLEHRIDWIYERPGLPLQVTGESGPWRRVRDPDGAQVWMHASNLENRRTAYVSAQDDVALRKSPSDNGHIVARLAPGVVGALTACEDGWRRIAVGARVGWVPETALWGAADCAGL